MIKKLVVLVLMLWCTNLYSQWWQDPIDSLVKTPHLSDDDWIISLSIQLAGMHYDSEGKTDSGDPNGTFIIRKTNGRFSLQKFKVEYDDAFRHVLKKDSILDIFDSVACSYTKDSICKSDREYIYPYIYRNDSLGIYDIQGQSDHSPYYELRMRTSQCEYQQKFMEIEMFTSPRFFEIFGVGLPENLNARHNMNTFVYRAFINFCSLLKRQYKIYILQ